MAMESDDDTWMQELHARMQEEETRGYEDASCI